MHSASYVFQISMRKRITAREANIPRRNSCAYAHYDQERGTSISKKAVVAVPILLQNVGGSSAQFSSIISEPHNILVEFIYCSKL